MTIAEIPIPQFGAPDDIPQIPSAVYRARLARVGERMRAAGRWLRAHGESVYGTEACALPLDLDTLRAEGFRDEDIVDAVEIIGFFNYYARMANALGVEPEAQWTEG